MVRLAVVLIAAASILATAEVAAQPGSSPGAPQHATPPMPQVMPSPMTSLPPPVSTAPGETRSQPFPNSTVPFSIAEPGFVAHVGSDGRVRFSDGHRSGGLLIDPTSGPGGRWSFDLTDMLFGGPDPHLAAKLAVLDSTRTHRLRMKANHETELMDRALGDLTHYLHAVWSHRVWSPTVRRRVLFELWDEAAERGNSLMVDGGVRARVIISHFIAARLPPGSQDAYTAAELAQLNQGRASLAAFAPYANAADPNADRLARGGAPTNRRAAVTAIAMMRHF
jgi:hypothetical protein